MSTRLTRGRLAAAARRSRRRRRGRRAHGRRRSRLVAGRRRNVRTRARRSCTRRSRRARSLFGQVLTAHARVVVDPRRIDPASVDLNVDLRPYSDPVGIAPGVARARTRGGRRLHLRDSVRGAGCVRTRHRPPVPRPSSSSLRRRRSTRDVTASRARSPVAWPAFGVQSRLTAEEIALSTPQVANGSTPPPVTWAISPGLLGGLALLGSRRCSSSAAGWLVASVVARRPAAAARSPDPCAPDAGRARARARRARGRARRGRREPEGARAPRRGVAAGGAPTAMQTTPSGSRWSERGPSPENVAELATDVRRNGAR